MTLGPVMIDIAGTALGPEDRSLLRDPLVGGVVLFSRNYADPLQLEALTREIHDLRQPPLLIAVDQEGGRVQRFIDGFLKLPPPRWIGRQYDVNPGAGIELARQCGYLMASELRARGVDFSFAPVLDIDYGLSDVIGDRAFHRNPEAVADLAVAYIAGMRAAGMAATGKHFPGHGGVTVDSHLSLPVDRREYPAITDDLMPFERAVNTGLNAVMAAHVIYSEVDDRLAGFSHVWIERELRQQMDFRGVVFSDDLSMKATEGLGAMPDRAKAALNAGCDMVLVCNDRPAARAVLDGLRGYSNPVSQVRLVRMHGKPAPDADALYDSEPWKTARAALSEFDHKPELTLDS